MTTYADVETASEDYASRFAGSIGRWMLLRQESLVLGMLKGDYARLKLLDVGGGHAQIAVPLSKLGCKAMVLGSSPEAGNRLFDLVRSGKCDYQVGDLLKIPFADRSFDVVISLRLISHCDNWPTLISELCRVSKLAVIIDFPRKKSVNALADKLFSIKKKIEGNTRAFTIFSDSEIIDAFEKSGFRLSTQQNQFFFPMAIHRLLKWPGFSETVEKLAAALGLIAFFGSPAIVKFERKES